MGYMTFTEDEVAYLRGQPLGRLATVAPDGTVQNSPVGVTVNTELGTIDIRGRELGKTRKFANIKTNPKVAVVVDDLVSTRPWRVRGVEIRGEAEPIHDADPPGQHYSREVIRVHPRRIITWGLDGGRARSARTVA